MLFLDFNIILTLPPRFSLLHHPITLFASPNVSPNVSRNVSRDVSRKPRLSLGK